MYSREYTRSHWLAYLCIWATAVQSTSARRVLALGRPFFGDDVHVTCHACTSLRRLFVWRVRSPDSHEGHDPLTPQPSFRLRAFSSASVGRCPLAFIRWAEQLVTTYPAVLSRSVEKNLEPKFKWLEVR